MNKKLSLVDKIKTTAASTLTSGLLNNEGIKENIVILPALKALIKPLTSEEYEGLKTNIVENGCQDSLKVWQTSQKVIDDTSETDEEAFVLIDGHNRHQICKETNTPFNITLMKFESLDNVKDWMVLLQLNRRNILPNELAYYRGLLYRNALKEDATKTNEEPSSEKGEPSVKKSVQVAGQFNVNEKTIRRDKDYSEGIDTLSPELKGDILTGKVKVSKQKIQDLAKIEVAEKIDTVEKIETTLSENAKEAEKEEVEEDVNPNQTDLFNGEGSPNEDLSTASEAEKVVEKTGKKSTKIPTAQRANLVDKFDKFMKTENKDDFENFQKLLKAVEKQLK